MSQIDVDIVTPARQAWSGKADSLQLPAWLGEMGVLPQHAAVLALTRAGVVSVVGESSQKFVVGTGFVEVGQDRVTLLVDTCEDVATIDVEQARRELDGAEKAFASAAPGSAEAAAATRRLDLARVRSSAR